jgi:hypothetical protein
MKKIVVPKAGWDENVIPPPSNVQVEATSVIVLYNAEGVPLKRQIGFKQ